MRSSYLALALTFVAHAGPATAQTKPANAVPIRVSDARAWEAIAAAEDARAVTPKQLAVLLDGSRSPTLELRRISVRALGRLQRADLADTIARALNDASPVIRAEAAHALALASIANRTPVAVRDTVRAALARERSVTVIGALAETLGRLRLANADSARIVAAELVRHAERGAAARVGAVRGLHFIVRQGVAIRPGLDVAQDALVRVATTHTDMSPSAMHARRIATATLAIAGLASDQVALTIMRDPDPFVRREAVLIAGPALRDTAAAHRIAARGLRDTFWLVRFEALRQLGLRFTAAASCSAIAPFTRDASAHVRLQAIDLLGARCVSDVVTVAWLDSVAGALPSAAHGAWHPAAHAIVALALREPVRALRRLPSFMYHPNLFVRTYAANAATAMRDTLSLRTLAADAAPNVRTAAVQGLGRIVGHRADSIYLAQLALDDGQLLMEAAAALDSSATPVVAARLLDALDRMTLKRSENSRDGRVAMLNVAGRLGDRSLASRVEPYLRDFDPQVADRAAAILQGCTGTDQIAAPRLLPPEPMPTYAEAAALARMRLRVEMSNGISFEVRLLPFDAPTNAARFARLARDGWFNGLTLHRVEPNFVVQGGSPNANEYAGAPRFSRDEIGYPNNRGTIGLSTRGHDTGDAQIYINIIDNTQLDPLYTVFAEVTSGMASVDRILEGGMIRRIAVIR
ncbi:MAG: peptidylprolyl isomerase [Longimicrobiales bacterium]